jgi:hypothetical protein
VKAASKPHSRRTKLTPTLADYRQHAELYGPELVVETAAHDLDEREVGELRCYVKHLQRTKRWKAGRWYERRIPRRPCEECGLDLPTGARADTQRHVHCRERAAKRRARARAKGMGQRPERHAGRASAESEHDVQEAA